VRIAVRPRRADDSRRVRLVARKAWRDAYARIAPAGFIREILRVAYGRERLLWNLTQSHRDAFVATVDGVVVGYADVLDRGGERVELARIYVLPEEQGRGVGTELLRAVTAAARRRGATRLEVGVDAQNRRALRWYEAQGFERTGTADFSLGRWTRPQVWLAMEVASEAAPDVRRRA
jgi:ribosomal protein S18 acetylase RimI-like enzyme